MGENPDLIALLKQGDDQTIRELYLNHKKSFFLFAKRYQLDEDELLDIYQDAIVALCDNAKRGKIDQLKGEISTYLFSIGKYMIYRRVKDQSRRVSMTDFDPDEMSSFSLEADEEDQSSLQLMGEALKKLGQQCQQVLCLFYYEEKKLDEIHTLLNYSSKDVLKAQKSRCLKQLRELLKGRKDG